MTSRYGWVALVVTAVFAFGCGKGDSPPAPKYKPDPELGELADAKFTQYEDGSQKIWIRKVDGTILIVEPKKIQLVTKDGLVDQSIPCPTCDGCNCRYHSCSPLCSRVLVEPKDLPPIREWPPIPRM